MGKIPVLLIVVILIFTGQAWAARRPEDSKGPMVKDGVIQWENADRKVNVREIDGEGKGSYAGFIIDKDDQGQPILVWMGLIPDGESWKLAIDANGDKKLEEVELFGSTKQENSCTQFTIKDLKICHLELNALHLYLSGDPAQDGKISLSLKLKSIQIGNQIFTKSAGWCSLKEAPIFDFYGFSIFGELAWPAKLNTRRMIFNIKTHGSHEKTKVVMSDKFVKPKDFEVTIKYPKANGEFGEITRCMNSAD